MFAEREILRSLAKRKIMHFTKYTWPEYIVNWHHELLAEKLDLFAQKKIPKLLVEMPPRHGKSELVTRRLSSFILGQNPDHSIIGCSYSGDLASEMNTDIQSIMSTQEYNELFPHTLLPTPSGRSPIQGDDNNYSRNKSKFGVVGKRGGYKAAGVGGSITGKGADFLLIDDPFKNSQEAQSKVIREKVWKWYTSTAFTRLEKNGSVLLTMTRWHEDDLAGRLLEKEGDEWVRISLPAIKEDNLNPIDTREVGEALWPWKYNEEKLKSIRKTVGERDWISLYQQRPAPEEGGIVKRKWLQYYKRKDCPEFDFKVMSVDATFKDAQNSDFVVISLWGRKGTNKYLIDQYRKKMGFTDTKRAIKTMWENHQGIHAVLVEDKANGSAIIETLREEIPCIIAINPKESKEARLFAVSTEFEGGNVFLPDDAEFTPEFVEELMSFPNGKHDDQVDSCTQALIYMKQRKTPSISAL